LNQYAASRSEPLFNFAHSREFKPLWRSQLVNLIQTAASQLAMLPLGGNPRGHQMHMSSESLLVILCVGLVAGWLAGQIVQGTGFGLIGDLIIGILGAFIGSWLLPQLGIRLGTGLISAILNATIGAVLLLLIVRLVRGGGWGWQRSWWRR
jgi:uncharacterized membrane protein YeaQ/YmgE (transglycosylase-associated protein family)